MKAKLTMKPGKILIALFVLLALGAGAYFSYKSYFAYKEAVKQRAEFKRRFERRKLFWRSIRTTLAGEIAGFRGQVGCVIKDLETGWEISFNKDELFPSASLAKIPIMAACFQAQQKGRMNFSDTVRLKGADKVYGSGVLKAMPNGSLFSVDKLIELMVTQSDNTAANILIGLLGRDSLEGYFSEFGLKNTNLSRKMMDFRARRRGRENYTTAADMAYILEKIYRGKFINDAVAGECISLLKQQKINDRIPALLPAGAQAAHKTGLEHNVCHDAGIVFTGKGDFLICVLTRHPGLSKSAKQLIANLAFYVYNYYQKL